MTPERWRKIEEIFDAAVEIDAEPDRARFLSGACEGDDVLRREVEDLLASDAEANSLMGRPALDESGIRALEPTDNGTHKLIGTRIGAYRVLKEIGSGGMGLVFLAERADGEFKGHAAIKLIKRGMDTDFILRRFRRERQILAALNHPFIARLLGGGSTDDHLPYFIMEFIRGEQLYRFCDTQKLIISDRLILFRRICEAVRYAHAQKIIHRDLKPSNVLVKSDGTPKLLDFGIAKVLDADSDYTTIDPTATALRMMTPEYASPEQIRGEDVGTASDIYSLGVLLYELLTGHRPYKFPSRAPHEVARVICEEEPESPASGITIEDNFVPASGAATVEDIRAARGAASLRELQRQLSGDLERIILKSLRKDPSDRYQSVKDLSSDISQFLEGKPVSAPIYAGRTRAPEKPRGPEIKSIAVLPLKILDPADSAGNAAEFMGVGLADALITRLSGARQLAVRPTSTVLRFAEHDADLLAAGRDLGVDFVLEGRVRIVRPKIRVSLQLLDTVKESIVWASRFDEMFTDALELEDSITARVVEAMLPELTQTERRKVKKRGTDSPEAYEEFMRGRFYRNMITPEASLKANECFERAIAIDPDYALVYAAVAECWFSIAAFGVADRLECWAAARRAAERAIELDDELAEAYSILGFIYLGSDFNTAKSRELGERSIELSPNYAMGRVLYTVVLIWEGEFDRAVEESTKAVELDPSPFNLQHVAWVLYNSRRYDEALAKCREVVSAAPDFPHSLSTAAWIQAWHGHYDEAVENSSRAIEASGAAPYIVGGLAAIYARAGRHDAAHEIFARFKGAAAPAIPNYQLAAAHAHLGDADSAFLYLESAFAERSVWLVWLKTDSFFDIIRDDPRFAALLERLSNAGSKSLALSENASNEKSSLAVLPFIMIRSSADVDTGDLYLGVGLADSLITRLSNVQRLQVRPTSSVLRYEHRTEDPFAAGDALNVAYVLDGTIRRIGERIRVSVQLLKTSTRKIAWANQFDEQSADALDLEDKLSAQVAQAIVPQLSGEEKTRLAKRGTQNAKARAAYLRGRYFWNQLTGEALKRAHEEFQAAIALDAGYALPLVGIADFYNWVSVVGAVPSSECLPKAKEAARHALAIDDSLGEAYAALSFSTLSLDLDWAEARRLALRAVELSPNYANAFECYSYLLTPLGQFDEGLEAIRRAEHLEPVSPRAMLMTAWTLYQSRRFAEASEKAQQALNLDPNFTQGFIHLGNSLQHQGRPDEAVAALYRAMELMPGVAMAGYILCHALVAANRRGEAVSVFEQMQQTAADVYTKPYFLAMCRVALGDFDAALDLFEKGLRERDQWFIWLATEPKLDPLRTHERFRSLLRQTNNPSAV
jgi:eukaryotic-like serine/threonine-protein kinase